MTIKSVVKGILGAYLMSAFLSGAPLCADGFIIPMPKSGETIPPLTVKYHHVAVEISNQAARTSIDQVFVNNYGRDIEGTYIFPLPENAAISEFAMWIGDKKVEGEVLDRERARMIYESIVRKMRDPALLEYIGRNMFRARIYPIPAHGEKRIRLSYTEIVGAEKELIRYVYPLNTEKFSRDPLREVSVSVKIESPAPILNVYSPSHRISVRKDGERRASAGYEEKNVRPDKDFVLYYSVSPEEVGISFVNWEGPEDKYFMLLTAPRFASDREKVIDKNIIFVLDSSGSMSGSKIRQAKDAARFIVRHLDERDRFSIIDFDDEVTLFSDELRTADQTTKGKALSFIDSIEDSGGTNINGALTRALAMTRSGDRPNYVLFLTDGLPTAGVVQTDDIVRHVGKANAHGSRIFVFGVGNDVNTALLDKISSDNRGTSVYVGEQDDLESAISNYYEKLSSPLLSDLTLEFKGIEVSAVYPKVLPDIFKGSQLVLIGKYQGKGPATVILKGKTGKEDKRFALENVELLKSDSMNFLARLWATRRIGYLLEEIRLHGHEQELIDEVKKLGLKYGIVTPYTSFLVTEEEGLTLEAAAPAAQEAMKAGRVSGRGAVMAAKVSQKLKNEDQASRVESTRIRYKDDKTFYLKNGIWTDSEFADGGPVKEVKFGSDDYFRLISEKPGLSRYMSIGTDIIVVYQGVNYKMTK